MKRYLADTSVWIVRRGWFCWRGYTNWSLISRCIVLEEYMKAKVLDESWKTDWKTVVEKVLFLRRQIL